MKRSILILALSAAAAARCMAQTACSSNAPLFKFDNTDNPKEIRTLGSNPEFPFLRNKSSASQVYSAIKKNANDKMNGAGMTELNNMLMEIGFSNGTQDLTPSSVSVYTIPAGTEGNMGSGGFTYAYCTLTGDPDGYKAWKIASPTGCYMYVLAKCGNAFFPKSGAQKQTACVNVPVTITSEPKEITTVSNRQQTTTSDIYVYYHNRRHRHAGRYASTDIPDANPSRPLLLNTENTVAMIPETYTVTVSTPDSSLEACQDKTMDVNANINVEQSSEYTGNYPTATTKKEYKKVSKRTYKKAERKMARVNRKERRAKRIERKVSNITSVAVNA